MSSTVPTTIHSGLVGGGTAGGVAGGAVWLLSGWLALGVALATLLILVASMWKLLPRGDRS